ncbi:MAG: hypothetical protein AAFY02_15745 [Pseudomonadota bacterium]
MRQRGLATVLLLSGLAACTTPASKPEALIGLTAPALQETLGPPQRIRREATAEIWQYNAARCVLDIFLYRDAGAPQVLHVEARDLQGRQANTGDCVALVETAANS